MNVDEETCSGSIVVVIAAAVAVIVTSAGQAGDGVTVVPSGPSSTSGPPFRGTRIIGPPSGLCSSTSGPPLRGAMIWGSPWVVAADVDEDSA